MKFTKISTYATRTPDTFFGRSSFTICFILLLILYSSIGACLHLLYDIPFWTPGSSIELLFKTMSTANISPDDFLLFTLSLVYLNIEMVILFLIMVCADINYAWLMLKKPEDVSENNQSIWKTLIFWLSFALGGLSTSISSFGLFLLLTSDSSLQGLFSYDPFWFYTTVGEILTLYGCSAIVWIFGDILRQRSYIHFYLSAGLIFISLPIAIITHHLGCGILLALVANPIVYVIIFILYDFIHKAFHQWVKRLANSRLFANFTQAPIETPGRLLRSYYARVFQLLIISKWITWCCGFIGDPNTIKIPLAIDDYRVIYLVIALTIAAWCYASYSLLATCLRLEQSTSKPKILLPIEPAFVWQLLVGDMFDLLKVSYLKHLSLYQQRKQREAKARAKAELNSNTFMRPTWGIKIRCVIMTLFNPTAGLTKQWLQIIMLKKIFTPGQFDEVYLLLSWKGILLLSVRGGSILATIGGAATTALVGAMLYEAVDQLYQVKTAINTLIESEGMYDAMKANKYGLNRKVEVVCRHVTRLETSSTMSKLMSGLFRGPLGIHSGSNEYTQAIDGIVDVAKTARKAGIQINDTPANSSSPNRILKTVKEYMDLSEGKPLESKSKDPNSV